jgi:hypothetical protein
LQAFRFDTRSARLTCPSFPFTLSTELAPKGGKSFHSLVSPGNIDQRNIKLRPGNQSEKQKSRETDFERIKSCLRFRLYGPSCGLRPYATSREFAFRGRLQDRHCDDASAATAP